MEGDIFVIEFTKCRPAESARPRISHPLLEDHAMSNELKLALIGVATALFNEVSGCGGDLSQLAFLGL